MLVALAHAVVLSPNVIKSAGAAPKSLPKGEALQELLAEAEGIIKQVLSNILQCVKETHTKKMPAIKHTLFHSVQSSVWMMCRTLHVSPPPKVYCEMPNYEVIVPALLEHGLYALPNHAGLTAGIPVKPMLAKPTKGISEVRWGGVRWGGMR